MGLVKNFWNVQIFGFSFTFLYERKISYFGSKHPVHLKKRKFISFKKILPAMIIELGVLIWILNNSCMIYSKPVTFWQEYSVLPIPRANNVPDSVLFAIQRSSSTLTIPSPNRIKKKMLTIRTPKRKWLDHL